MTTGIRTLFATVLLFTVAKLAAQTGDATYISFDVPDSVSSSVIAINPGGLVVGQYQARSDDSFRVYLRVPGGAIVNVPLPPATYIYPAAINASGTITGYYQDTVPSDHGFLRTLDGTVTTFDAPGAGPGTVPAGITSTGTVVGSYTDTNGADRGFLRFADGTFTSFDCPGSSLTFPNAINDAGVTTGYCYRPVDSYYRFFVRASDGSIRLFNPPGGIPNVCGYCGPKINRNGVIAGDYQGKDFVSHGFLRSVDGVITSFDAPGAGKVSHLGLGTFVKRISPSKVIVGEAIDYDFSKLQYLYTGFERLPDGTFVTIEVPGANNTFLADINPAGTIAGGYNDTLGGHGFLRIP